MLYFTEPQKIQSNNILSLSQMGKLRLSPLEQFHSIAKSGQSQESNPALLASEIQPPGLPLGRHFQQLVRGSRSPVPWGPGGPPLVCERWEEQAIGHILPAFNSNRRPSLSRTDDEPLCQ